MSVDVHRNLEYRPLADGEWLPLANKLDLYVPRGATNFPVIVSVHGGAWIAGDKLLDFIPWVATKFAEQGFGVVAVNYRLSPLVRHPSHIEDVAQALAWTVNNIQTYGGRSDVIMLVGHSAGGHLVSLAATDAQYLKAAGVSREAIRCVVSVSGVYEISELTINSVPVGVKLSADVATASSPFALVFGPDPEVWQKASPQTHVAPGLPPFLLITASCDLPALGGMANKFHAQLQANGVSSQLVRAQSRGHATNFWRMAIDEDQTFTRIVAFLKTHVPQTNE